MRLSFASFPSSCGRLMPEPVPAPQLQADWSGPASPGSASPAPQAVRAGSIAAGIFFSVRFFRPSVSVAFCNLPFPVHYIGPLPACQRRPAPCTEASFCLILKHRGGALLRTPPQHFRISHLAFRISGYFRLSSTFQSRLTFACATIASFPTEGKTHSAKSSSTLK